MQMTCVGSGRHKRSLGTTVCAAVILIGLAAEPADARRGKNIVRGAVIGAGVGALVDGGRGARTGAVAGALVGATQKSKSRKRRYKRKYSRRRRY